jgi:hypothetical protein
LPDCTHLFKRRALFLCAAVLALGLSIPRSALADGDPASDVLASQPLFLPQDAAVSAADQQKLEGLLSGDAQVGLRLRVAIVASPGDLGSVTALWRRPAAYARFLGQELSLVYRGPLLVVMPNGYGFSQLDGQPVLGQSALAKLGAPGQKLGSAALTASLRIAAAEGHVITFSGVPRQRSRRSNDLAQWLVLATGAALMAVVWAASLRAKPLRLGRRRPSSAH